MPIGNHRDAASAPAAPSRPPNRPASVAAAAAATTACRGVIPTARMVRSSAAPPAAYRAIAWPTSTIAAISAAPPKASRQRASKVTVRWMSRCWPGRSQMSMSCRWATRSKSRRNCGSAASPPRSRINAFTNETLPLLFWSPTMLSGYRAVTAGEIASPPLEPGWSENHGERMTPTMVAAIRGPCSDIPFGPASTEDSSPGVGSWMVTRSPTPW